MFFMYFALAFISVTTVTAHPQYLDDCPNLHAKYFGKFGDGAVGHSGGVSGARLNSFGHDFGGDDDACAIRAAADDDDDDDDDDDHHHHKHRWNLKFCCADSDRDGQYNGWELGDPCCDWKPGDAAPLPGFSVSHPGMASEQTSEPKESAACPGYKNPCSAFLWRDDSAKFGNSSMISRPWRAAFVQGKNARAIFAANDAWHLVDTPAEASLIWVRNRCVIAGYQVEPGQAVNRLPRDRALADKSLLYEALTRNLPTSQHSFLPETYILRDIEGSERNVRDLVHVANGTVWILKPASLSKGLGVQVLQDLGAWSQRGGVRKALASGRGYVLQRYIANPLLLAGYKSEVRVYFLVASLRPLHVLWFPEGSVRLGALPYIQGDYDNSLRHVVNTAVGKRILGKEAYDRLVSDSPRKWSFAALADHLQESMPHIANPWSDVMSQMRAALVHVMTAVVAHLRGTLPDGGSPFALFGADFILDSDLKAWMTEVQEGPGLSHVGDSVKASFVPRMLQQVGEIAVSVADRKKRGLGLDDVERGTDFQHLLGETSVFV